MYIYTCIHTRPVSVQLCTLCVRLIDSIYCERYMYLERLHEAY